MKEKITLNNIVKLTIVLAVLLMAGSVFYYFVIFIPEKEEAKQEQEQKEYVAKRKGECYDIYLQEKENWSNVKTFSYSEVRDVCIVKYKSDEPAKTEEECGEMLKNILEIESDTLRDVMWDSYINCFENWFSKTF